MEEYITLGDCLKGGTHLADCDDDGYCNFCGLQDSNCESCEDCGTTECKNCPNEESF